MKQETFNIIKTNLENRIKACKEHLDHIQTTEDLSNISIKEFVELKSFAKKEQVDMTEIVMVDLYHILGMGELTMPQRNLFLKLMNEYTSYRSDIKALSVMDNIEKLPKLPSRSSFKLHKLGDITLTSKLRGRCEEAAETVVEDVKVEDYGNTKQADIATPVTYNSIELQGSIIEFNREDVDEVIAAVNKSANREKIFKSAEGRVAYCDVVWEYTDSEHEKIRGIFITNAKRDSVRDKLKSKGLLK